MARHCRSQSNRVSAVGRKCAYFWAALHKPFMALNFILQLILERKF